MYQARKVKHQIRTIGNEIKYRLNLLDTKLRKYEVIIIGEDHYDEKCIQREYEVIERVKPTVILHEGTSHETYYFQEKLPSPKDLERITGIKVPNNQPLYLWSLNDFEEYMDKLDKVIEELEEKRNVDNYEKERIYRVRTALSLLYHEIIVNPGSSGVRGKMLLVDISQRHKIPIVGIDDEKYKEHILQKVKENEKIEVSIYEKIGTLENGENDFSEIDFLLNRISENYETIEELNRKRETMMADNIENALEIYGKPAIAIVGKDHMDGIKRNMKKRKVKIIDVTRPKRFLEKLLTNVVYRYFLSLYQKDEES